VVDFVQKNAGRFKRNPLLDAVERDKIEVTADIGCALILPKDSLNKRIHRRYI